MTETHTSPTYPPTPTPVKYPDISLNIPGIHSELDLTHVETDQLFPR